MEPLVPPEVGIGIFLLLLLMLGIAFWRSATNLQGHTRAGAEVIVMGLPVEACSNGDFRSGELGDAALVLEVQLDDEEVAGVDGEGDLGAVGLEADAAHLLGGRRRHLQVLAEAAGELVVGGRRVLDVERVEEALAGLAEALDRLHRRLIQLKIEREALKKEDDEGARKSLAALEGEIAKLEKEYADLDEQWKAEKAQVAGSAGVKEELERAKQEYDVAYRAGDHGRASEIRYGVIPSLEKRLAQASQDGEAPKKFTLLRNSVTEEEIAEAAQDAVEVENRRQQAIRNLCAGAKIDARIEQLAPPKVPQTAGSLAPVASLPSAYLAWLSPP